MDDLDQHLEIKTKTFPWHLAHLVEAHEELWVFDHEGFHGLLTGECSPVEARELADLIAALDNPDAYAAYRDYVGAEFATLSEFEDFYCGWYETEEEYARELAEDVSTVVRGVTDEWPYNCIDWERAWRELTYGGDNHSVTAPRGGFFIFRSL